MPIETNIIMELVAPRERSFEEVVIVSQGSKVRFIVRMWVRFLRLQSIYTPLRFTLYFENRPPQGFERNIKVNFGPGDNTIINYRDNTYQDIVLAEGIAASRGDFKYGIKAEQGGEELFDEDPILRII